MSHSAHCARQICKRDSSVGERRPDGATAWGRILWRPGRNGLGENPYAARPKSGRVVFPSFTESTKLARSQDSPIHSRTRGKASSLSPPMQARACAEPNVPARIEARREERRRAARAPQSRRPPTLSPRCPTLSPPVAPARDSPLRLAARRRLGKPTRTTAAHGCVHASPLAAVAPDQDRASRGTAPRARRNGRAGA